MWTLVAFKTVCELIVVVIGNCVTTSTKIDTFSSKAKCEQAMIAYKQMDSTQKYVCVEK